jgi:hypothetical protein
MMGLVGGPEISYEVDFDVLFTDRLTTVSYLALLTSRGLTSFHKQDFKNCC